MDSWPAVERKAASGEAGGVEDVAITWSDGDWVGGRRSEGPTAGGGTLENCIMEFLKRLFQMSFSRHFELNRFHVWRVLHRYFSHEPHSYKQWWGHYKYFWWQLMHHNHLWCHESITISLWGHKSKFWITYSLHHEI